MKRSARTQDYLSMVFGAALALAVSQDKITYIKNSVLEKSEATKAIELIVK